MGGGQIIRPTYKGCRTEKLRGRKRERNQHDGITDALDLTEYEDLPLNFWLFEAMRFPMIYVVLVRFLTFNRRILDYDRATENKLTNSLEIVSKDVFQQINTVYSGREIR